jgi:transposase
MAPNVSAKTVKRRLAQKHLKKWMAQERVHLDEDLAQKRLEWTLAHRNWTRQMWRRKAMWGDEVAVERGGGKRRKCVFRYPYEKWNKDCVEPKARRGERGISQMMTGCFYSQTHGLFWPVFLDHSSARSRVTGKSIIDVYDHYDFLGIWENIREKAGEEEVFFIIDNAKTHLPFMRWLREQEITLMEIPAYSPDLNPIENIWSLVKGKLHKHYPELYLMKGDVNMVKKAIVEAITHCWELLNPKVFDTLAGSMVDRIETIIKADRWYTKY